MSINISVITPTIRPKGLPIVEKALKRQVGCSFEWLVGSKFFPKVHCQHVKDVFKGGYWTLNRMYNSLIEASIGELIVSWQDFTYADPDCLHKFWTHYQNNKKSLVSAVGNKYADKTWSAITWQDPRERSDMGSFYEVYPNDIEWNLCACPKKALYEIGGFCELFDFNFFGMDGYGVNERLNELGYKFYLDQTIKSYSLEHNRPSGWNKHNGLDGGYSKIRDRLKSERKWPKMSYLGI